MNNKPLEDSIVSIRMKDTKFHRWLRESVGDEDESSLRWKVLQRFVDEGLVPWITRHGYNWGITSTHLRNCIATGLYESQKLSHLESNWSYSKVHYETAPEVLDHYHHVLGPEKWETFWSKWGHWSDVDESSYWGQDRRQDIEAFVWWQLDLDTSPQMDSLYEIIMGGEEEDPYDTVQKSWKQPDTYLQETVEYNGWAGYRR